MLTCSSSSRRCAPFRPLRTTEACVQKQTTQMCNRHSFMQHGCLHTRKRAAYEVGAAGLRRRAPLRMCGTKAQTMLVRAVNQRTFAAQRTVVATTNCYPERCTRMAAHDGDELFF